MGAQRTKKEAEQPRRRKYRLNKKKFLTTLFLFVCFAAVITVAIISLENAGNFKALLPQDGIPIKTEYNIIEKTQTQTANSEDILDGRIIVIDPGHGGFDPGAISDGGTHEAEINLKIAQYLKAEIDSLGAQVIMTREDDSGLGETQDESLQERRRIIEQSGSDIVVSIHINSHKEDVNVSGPLVLFMPGSQEGKSLAEKIQMHLNAVAEVDGTACSEELYVLKSGNQPCVLVECGYISNVEEEAKLCQADYQQRIAESICEGIKAYFS